MYREIVRCGRMIPRSLSNLFTGGINGSPEGGWREKKNEI